MTGLHDHEEWQIREDGDGGLYCAACGEAVPPAGLPTPVARADEATVLIHRVFEFPTEPASERIIGSTYGTRKNPRGTDVVVTSISIGIRAYAAHGGWSPWKASIRATGRRILQDGTLGALDAQPATVNSPDYVDERIERVNALRDQCRDFVVRAAGTPERALARITARRS